jgi:Rps23 Pro-64 3,4-dihydroxylase Tpa1-like proline 4-hydroxylase
MSMLLVENWNLDELALRWRSAQPFPYVVLDDVVDAATLEQLRQAASAEPHWPNRGEIYDFMASGETVYQPALKELETELGTERVLDAVRTISGREMTHANLRSYVYQPGSYLLPHSDSRSDVGRVVAYVMYIWLDDCVGGELELFSCEMNGDELVHAHSAELITPRPNRLVLFDVTNASLHQVREVLAGTRVSLTGWFLA